MQVQVLRGENQIGSSIVKIVSGTTRLILDVGSEIESTHTPKVPRIEGLFRGEAGYDAVLISHHFLDHAGLIPYVVPQIPIYMSRRTYEFYRYTAEYQRMNVLREPILFEDQEQDENGHYTFVIGDIRVTPILCSDYGFDAWMFLLESGGERILYTGGLCNDSREISEDLLGSIPQADTLVVEGTMLSRPFSGLGSERMVEQKLEELMQPLPPVFLIASSTNVRRFESFAEAASRSSRTLLVDVYQAGILSEGVRELMNEKQHPEIRVFLSGSRGREQTDIQRFSHQQIDKDMIPFKHIAMCVRPSRVMEQYLSELNAVHPLSGSVLIVSMWRGFREQKDVKRFLEHCEKMGMRIEYVHTAGTLDLAVLKAVAKKSGAEKIIPVHAYEPEKLAALLR
ncbi:MAG: hypothetical protein IJV26_00990 [Lachnospiraceae bacterium]|nr:hypothetical protein [Lachnospiraceae bacterium]MBQ9642597.1 hypothetical protein [Lachnospiraceae bacterium]